LILSVPRRPPCLFSTLSLLFLSVISKGQYKKSIYMLLQNIQKKQCFHFIKIVRISMN
jgi:hypothetical protein